jgi:RNA polymerase sigma-70 factor (ECF subfamily)
MKGDSELIMKAQSGDMTAFSELVQRHDRAVLSLAARYVDNAEDAKDIFQEVLIKVYRGLPAFQFRSEFSTWVHRITVNVCLTYKARSRSDRHVSLDSGGEDNGESDSRVKQLVSDEEGPDSRAAGAHTAALVQEALRVLSPQQRMVFVLRHYDGHSLKEIAHALRCTEGTVKRYLFTATRRLREQLRHVL